MSRPPSVEQDGKTWQLPPVQVRFKRDLERAGYTVEWYRGRYFYCGYAARVADRVELLMAAQATAVHCTHDDLALGFILYPTIAAQQVPARKEVP